MGLTPRFLIGHSSDREFEPYQSVVSSIEFPTMFRGIQQRLLVCLTGISLNRSNTAPRTGTERAKRTEDGQAALNELNTVCRLLLADHGSLSSVGRSADPQWKEYQTA
jgi:hypothetical protein